MATLFMGIRGYSCFYKIVTMRSGLTGKYSSYLCSIIQKISIFAT